MASLIESETSIGTVSLSVGDLDRSLAYYQDHIGLSDPDGHGIEIYRDRPRSMRRGSGALIGLLLGASLGASGGAAGAHLPAEPIPGRSTASRNRRCRQT